jgi:hypothetical protein
MMEVAADAFGPLREALESAGVRFAIGGSWASTAYGDPRFTNDVDILVEFSSETLDGFLHCLSKDFYVDPEQARRSLKLGRPFNVIYMPQAFKFDLFPASAFALGSQELDRAIFLPHNGLAAAPTPFVSPEDIVLAKLHWFRSGGEGSEVQWRDILGLIRSPNLELDRPYLLKGADQLGVLALLHRALGQK